MSGRNVLWMPGTDHAGIATQVVVEKKLQRERGITRHDLGREAFVNEVWKWKDQYGNRIKEQLKRLGSSLDWSRECFTMDEKLSKAVVEAFVRLYDQGLIYRGVRLVNWCSALKTAISDIEVDKKELAGRTLLPVPGHDGKYEFGVLVSFAYKVEETDEEIIIATTRIETMLGDTAVAVHPDDQRYTHLHGKFLKHPFNGRRIPIITDGTLVDMTFGTGAVKVTPAHDPNDYDCGKRNNLEFINIFDDDGAINENGAPFQGMKRFDARNAIMKALEEKGLLKEVKDNPMVLPVCSRSKDVIEPRLKPQWWVVCQGMASEALAAAKDGRLEFIPASHNTIWNSWLNNCHDWCVSRQLWWGHRIPAYLVTIEGKEQPDGDNQSNWVIARSHEEAMEKAILQHPDVDPSKIKLEQDPDVLDTWFSSGLFPFSTLGWPNVESPDYKAFYPNALLETGHDIIFFWVARMVMMGITLTGQVPFSQVYLHAMVRDAHGRKMSKSLGNVIDPIDVTEGIKLEDMQHGLEQGNLDLAELAKAKAGQQKDFPKGISECGTDAMRFALCAYTSQGRDVNLDIDRVVGYRNFCNKIWNATKFALMNLGDHFKPNANAALTGKERPMEKWILSRLSHAIIQADEAWRAYDFSKATTAIHSFWLYELCDVYLEAIKPLMRSGDPDACRGSQDTLYTCIEMGLRLLHPFMPFVTEELWQRIPRREGSQEVSIMTCQYPAPAQVETWRDEQLENTVKLTLEITRATRAMRDGYGIKPGVRLQVFITLKTDELVATFQSGFSNLIDVLACADVIILPKTKEAPEGCAINVVNENCEINLQLKGLIDFAVEIKKLEKNKEKTLQQLEALQKKMQAKDYETKVPKNVQLSNDERVIKMKQEIEALDAAILRYQKLSASN
eukprot:TRINITY_DN844_c1_g1_i2.p1 TRINITY_DN844_c1_g1~~TRINITY_DN844_c1_g1_i2.p1  ORF type:complete len:900 (+),score=163.70 TRINITY_DN844_c1_g1_i2:628-3327(+)